MYGRGSRDLEIPRALTDQAGLSVLFLYEVAYALQHHGTILLLRPIMAGSHHATRTMVLCLIDGTRNDSQRREVQDLLLRVDAERWVREVIK